MTQFQKNAWAEGRIGQTDPTSQDPSYCRGPKNIKLYNENNNSSFLIYFDENNLYGKTMQLKLSVDGFEWDKISKFAENFIKKNDNSDIGSFLKIDIKYSEHLGMPHKLPCLPEKKGKLINMKNLLVLQMTKNLAQNFKTSLKPSYKTRKNPQSH